MPHVERVGLAGCPQDKIQPYNFHGYGLFSDFGRLIHIIQRDMYHQKIPEHLSENRKSSEYLSMAFYWFFNSVWSFSSWWRRNFWTVLVWKKIAAIKLRVASPTITHCYRKYTFLFHSQEIQSTRHNAKDKHMCDFLTLIAGFQFRPRIFGRNCWCMFIAWAFLQISFPGEILRFSICYRRWSIANNFYICACLLQTLIVGCRSNFNAAHGRVETEAIPSPHEEYDDTMA